MSATRVTTSPAGTAAPPAPWWRRPKPLLGAGAALALLVLLTVLGNRRLRFRPTVTGDPAVGFDVEFARSLVPQVLDALTVTAMATVYGFLVALVLGLVLALLRRSRLRVVRWPAAAFIEFVRSTPLLVQLIFLYNGLTAFGITLGPIQALVIGLGVHYATYCSEAYRAGINSVPVGQWEAATAMNLGPRLTWTRVILPQAIPNVVPVLGNYLVAGFKDAPLGSAVQVTGVLTFATSISAQSFRSVEPYLLVGAAFLLVSIPAAWLVRRLEARVGYERT